MSNSIDGTGITIQTLPEIISDIINGTPNTPGFVQIYGPDINVDSNTPDGNMINIFALSKMDVLSLILSDYNSKDPDQAVGVALDAVCQLCGISRKGGTYTQVVLTIVVTSALNLNGISTGNPFTVQDVNGNLYYLITSASLIIGINNLNFQAANIGFIQVLANTINLPVTIIAGLTSVNNATTPYQIGADQETDAQLRLRRQASTAFPAQGFNQGLYAGLNQIVGLEEAVIYENDTSLTNIQGVPGHSIWVIVNGGSESDVGNAIYKYRNAGCGMRGATSLQITQVDGSIFTVYFDYAINQNLYVQMHVQSVNGGVIDETAITTGLVAQYLLGINQEADTTSIDAIVKNINPNALATNIQVSGDNVNWFNIVLPVDLQHQFVLIAGNVSYI